MSRLVRAATRLCIAAAAFASLTNTALAEAGSGASVRPSFLEVTLNGQRQAEPVLFIEGADGVLYVPAAALAQWRIRPPAVPPVRMEGEDYYRLAALTGLRVRVSGQDQSVSIDAPAEAFQGQSADLDDGEQVPMSRPSTGAFVNYDVLVEHSRGRTTATGAVEVGLFTPHGVGQAGFVASAGSGPDRVVRLDTSWTIDRPGNATTIRIGDSISSAGPGGAPVRFAGVQYYRNFAVRPGFITMPLPSGSGSAAVPSVVDIYVNNVLQSSREVAPGPFELDNIPVQSGGGTVQLVVRDLLGREVVSEQSYYASTQLLRRGLHEFSYEAGFIRRNFGRRSMDYGALMASTTHRYGISDRMTAEAHLQVSEKRQMAGASLTLLAFDLGQLGGSASVSHSERGTGFRVAGSFERRTRALSVGLLSEYASRNYAVIGMPDDFVSPRFTVQAFADLPLSRGAVGFNLLYRSMRDRSNETLAGLFGSWQLSRDASLHLFARRSVVGRRETVVGAHLTLALGGRRSASAGIEHGRRGLSGRANYQSNPPAGTGGGYRLSAGFGQFERVEAAYVHNLPMATLSAQAAYAHGSAGLRVAATGAIGLVAGEVFASRSLGESFAAVTVADHPGLKVYADEQLVGVTDADGTIVIPGLRPFEPNRIRIDDSDLPLDERIETPEIVIRPFARTGTRVDFAVKRERGLLMRVRRADGSDLPAGARVSVAAGDASYVVASGGEIYVPELAGTARFTADWSGGRCSFTAAMPEGDDPQPRLDDLVCREEPSYAAH